MVFDGLPIVFPSFSNGVRLFEAPYRGLGALAQLRRLLPKLEVKLPPRARFVGLPKQLGDAQLGAQKDFKALCNGPCLDTPSGFSGRQLRRSETEECTWDS